MGILNSRVLSDALVDRFDLMKANGSVFTRVPAVQTPAEEVKAILVDQTLEDLKVKALDDLINAQMTVTRADLEAMSDVDLRAARDTARADAENIDRSSPASRRT